MTAGTCLDSCGPAFCFVPQEDVLLYTTESYLPPGMPSAPCLPVAVHKGTAIQPDSEDLANFLVRCLVSGLSSKSQHLLTVHLSRPALFFLVLLLVVPIGALEVFHKDI